MNPASSAPTPPDTSITLSKNGSVIGHGEGLPALLAQTPTGLNLVDGDICAHGSSASRLQRALSRLQCNTQSLTIVFPGQTQGRALILNIHRLDPEPTAEQSQAFFSGSFSQATNSTLPDSGQICEALGLSPAEALLALSLAQGISADEHASQRGVTKHTVRSQLAVIRKKTGARSQTQIANLVWLLANAGLSRTG